MNLADRAFRDYVEKATTIPVTNRWLRWRHWQWLHGAIPHILVRAREARERAVSYRGFKVGCALVAYRPDYERPWAGPNYPKRYAIFEGWNVKRSKNDLKCSCGERMALKKATRAGYPMVLALAVVGLPQPDDKTGISGQTLRPCAKCRRTLEATQIVYNRTLVVTATPDETHVEVHTTRELFELFSAQP